MNRPISTRTHGLIDYTTGALLLAAPELLRLRGVRASALAPRLAGAGATAYSALTDYELGFARRIPMRAHLALDAASGAMLAASPWVLGYARHGRRHWLPHVLVGTGEILAAAATKTKTPLGARLGGRRSRIGAFALLALGIAAVVANRDRLRALASSRNGTAEEPVFTSVGMASTGGGDAETSAEDETVVNAAPSSETPGTTAPPL